MYLLMHSNICVFNVRLCFHVNYQDDTTFEKQSALFALAISDVVLINM